MNYEFKSDLAKAYFPFVSTKSAARSFRKLLSMTPGLMDDLLRTGYRKEQKRLTPMQVKLIFAHLGEP